VAFEYFMRRIETNLSPVNRTLVGRFDDVVERSEKQIAKWD
jgi:hypothetical protein